MPVPNQILDGTPPYGTKGTITLAGTAYIIEDEDLTPNWGTAEDRTATGNPSRKRWVKGRYTLKLKLQMASAATPYPPPGTTFTYAVKNEASAPTFVIVETPEKRNNETSFIEVIEVTAESVVYSITTA